MIYKQPRLRRLALGALVSLSLALPAWATNPFTLRDIRVEGLQRVEPGTVFASLPFRVGDAFTEDQGSAAIRALFGLGLFSDVRLQVEGEVLVVIVEERPTVSEISFTGVREFDNDLLRRALRDVGLTEGRPFDRALADRAEQELKRQYLTRSMYAATVTATVTPIERNRVNLNFHVVEGGITRIGELRIVGNQAFSDSTLLSLFALDTGNWLSWYTRSDRYSRERLNADLETLRSHYLTRGFLEFTIDSTQVAITPDKGEMAITINITEGQRFVVSGVRLEGDYLGREEEFKTFIRIRPGQAYNAEDVSETVRAFGEHFGRFGFAFARVEAVPEIKREQAQVALVLRAEPSRRAFVRRIEIEGNERTRDEVIRREFRQFESAWYDGDRIRLSRDRVDRLGFFTQVMVDTREVPGAPDQVDLVVAVEERATGSLSIGAGYGQADGISFVAGIKQENIFGTGHSLNLSLNTSRFNEQFVLSTTNPYFTQDGVSRTLDVFYRTSRPLSEQAGDYRLVTPGASIRFGVPFTETDTVFFGLGVEQTRIEPGAGLPLAFKQHMDVFGPSSISVPITVGWARDGRDSALVPTSGRLMRLNGELGLFGDTRYWRLSGQLQQYIPLTNQLTLAFNAEVGWGRGLGDKPFPVFKNFFGGGLGSVRGFEQGTLGGTSGIVGQPGALSYIGGSRMAVLNTEILAPFPGAGNDRTLRLFGFVDIGNVSDDFNQQSRFSDFRASAGVGISWLSPVGPLRIAYARPLRQFANDKPQSVQFQIGTTF